MRCLKVMQNRGKRNAVRVLYERLLCSLPVRAAVSFYYSESVSERLDQVMVNGEIHSKGAQNGLL
jgi:hypothetical protein